MKYVAVSGGADSTALALLMHERGEEFEMVFADTGAELPETYYTLARLAHFLDKRLIVVNNGTFFHWLTNKGYLLPAVFCRWCTRLLKQQPQDAFFEKDPTAIVYVGIRADESHRMAPKCDPVSEQLTLAGGVQKHSRRTEKPYVVGRPLVDAGYDKRDVMRLCEKYDLLNPVYSWRSNVSCFCCFFQKKSDWLGLLKHHPELYALAEQWEEMSSYWTQKMGAGARYTWREKGTLQGLRTADEAQLKAWPEPDEEPCAICSW